VISKELLNSVYEYSGDRISDIELSGTKIYYTLKQGTCFARQNINIHELAHRVKECANIEGYALYSGKDDNIWIIATEEYFLGKPQGKLEIRDEFTSDTYAEAIFKAGQWILENR